MLSNSQPRALQRFLAETPRLQYFVNASTHVPPLTRQVLAALPAHLRPHVKVAQCEKGILTLLVRAPEWATQLRFHENAVLQHFSQGGTLTIHRVIIKLDPTPPANLPPIRPTRQLSGTSATVLEQTAKHISHPPLAAALNRLARRASAATHT